MEEILKFIFQQMSAAGLNYHLEHYNTSKPAYPYHIGSLLPTIPMTEDGLQEYTFTIDSFNRGTMTDLLKETDKLEELFPMVEGKQTIVGNQFIVVYYLTSQPIDTGEDELKRIQTQLLIKTWKGRK